VIFQSDDLEGIVRDRTVWSPIYMISGTLDTTLRDSFKPDYGPRLEAAKERLRADLYDEADEPTVPTVPSEYATTAPQAHQRERGAVGNHGESGHDQ
jgi:hypothetical protein